MDDLRDKDFGSRTKEFTEIRSELYLPASPWGGYGTWHLAENTPADFAATRSHLRGNPDASISRQQSPDDSNRTPTPRTKSQQTPV